MTEVSRTVYGGGGITPDEKYESPKLTRLQAELYRNGLFNFTRSYFGSHSTSLAKGWMPDDSTLNELKKYLHEHGTVFTDEEFDKHHDWIRRYLSKEKIGRASCRER